MIGARFSFHECLAKKSSSFHPPRRRARPLSCRAQASTGTDEITDAIQALRAFEKQELSSRFKVSGWSPLQPMTALQRMELGDALALVKKNPVFERRLDNCVVPGKLSGAAVKADTGKTAISAITGADGARCILVVLNAIAPGIDNPSSRLPRGAKVAVKEPILASTLGGSTAVLVAPCHAALEFFELDEDASPITEEEAQVLRKQGKELFERGQYILAAQLYGSVISRLSVKGEEYVLATSERAACFIKLRLFEDAIADCNKALEVNPRHERSWYRKGVALGELREYKRALSCLNQAENKESKALKSRFSGVIQQAEKLSFNLDDYYTGGCKEKDAPECHDYFGPVEVRMTKDGKGRGLFVTKDVVLGELLLVSNAMCYVGNYDVRLSATDLQDSLEAEALQVFSSSSTAFRQLKSLSDAKRAPDMVHFRPGNSNIDQLKAKEFIPLDVQLVFNTLRRLRFGDFELGNEAAAAARFAGAWGLPAMVNHSCLPNISVIFVGRALFMRASRPLRAGEELFLCYVDALAAWSTSRSQNMSWDFQCNCARCMLEKRHNRVLGAVFESFPRRRAEGKYEEWLQQLARFCLKLEAAIDKLRLSQTETEWIRATAASVYVLCLCNMDDVRSTLAGCSNFPTALQMMKALHATAPGQFSTSRLVAQLTEVILNEESMPVCLAEFSSRYGWELYLKPNVLAHLLKWLKTT